ncbi:hypothetical protein GCM10010260_59770 [Streptomyces filipinensis]|uniref:Uncharacterized protein n=1 Tax=Streptomyces filipinensis TaxID=66887 RepID=A0A918MEE8_9ACTN|nr:hypothetical protein GCM10010260_59770 [Streptomyces filipinensis]
MFDERSADQCAALVADPDHGKSVNGFQGLVRLRVDSEAGLRALVRSYAPAVLFRTRPPITPACSTAPSARGYAPCTT